MSARASVPAGTGPQATGVCSLQLLVCVVLHATSCFSVAAPLHSVSAPPTGEKEKEKEKGKRKEKEKKQRKKAKNEARTLAAPFQCA